MRGEREESKSRILKRGPGPVNHFYPLLNGVNE